MSDPYVGEIRMFGGNFAPVEWAFCDGSLLSVSQFGTLFSLIGTTYGGDGVNTFALPDLRGRIPIHVGTDNLGNNYVLGQRAGTETVSLTTQQIPAHNHIVVGSSVGSSTAPTGNTYGGGQALYSSAAPSVTMSQSTIGVAGSSQAHDNVMPFLCINFIIALVGIFPPQN